MSDTKLTAPFSTLQWVDCDSLKLNDYNPNKVSQENLKLLTQSILSNGFTMPIVVRPDLSIIDGFRERRIMARIRDYMEKQGGLLVSSVIRNEDKREFDSPEDKKLYEATQRAKIESGNLLPGHKYSVTTRTEATYDVIHRLEEALTRCQAQKQKCIRNLMELRRGMNDSGEVDERVRLEVEAVIRNAQITESGSNETGSGNPVSAESSG